MAFKGAKFKGVDKVQRDFQKFLDASKKNRIILDDIGETAVKYIRGSVRARRKDYKIDDIQPKTKALRKALAKYNPTDPTFKSERSNLTFTGEFLNSMGHKINTAASQVTIFFEGVHNRYIGKNGQRIGEEKSNASIAAKLNGNPKFRFLFISKQLETTLKRRIVAQMRRQLSNYRKAKKILSR